MHTSSLVSVILPCYNESGNIIPLIEEVHRQLNFCAHEIIVVDDNSPDGTFNLVESKKYHFTKAYLRISDASLAKSIRKGLEEAQGDILIVMDSDFNHQPSYLPQLVKNLEYYDCVSASRFVYGGSMSSRSRHLASWIFNVFVRLITRKYVTDSLYGFFAIKKEVLQKVNFDKIFWGYGDYYIRLLYYLQVQKITILQIPAVNGERLKGEGNRRFMKVFIQYFIATIKLRLARK